MAASLAAAATMLECPKAMLKMAKAQGADGFRANGSVCISELKAWLETNDVEMDKKTALECRKLEVHCKRAEHEYAVALKLYTSNEQVAADTLRRETALRGEVLAFIHDMPSLAGMAPEQMHAAGMRWFDETLCPKLSTLK